MSHELDFLKLADNVLDSLKDEAESNGHVTLAYLLDIAHREVRDELPGADPTPPGGVSEGKRLVDLAAARAKRRLIERSPR